MPTAVLHAVVTQNTCGSEKLDQSSNLDVCAAQEDFQASKIFSSMHCSESESKSAADHKMQLQSIHVRAVPCRTGLLVLAGSEPP